MGSYPEFINIFISCLALSPENIAKLTNIYHITHYKCAKKVIS